VSLEREREKGVERATVSTESESRGWLASNVYTERRKTTHTSSLKYAYTLRPIRNGNDRIGGLFPPVRHHELLAFLRYIRSKVRFASHCGKFFRS
jgi:hypothetical protein